MTRANLFVLNGLSGTRKSGLARRIARYLRYPCFGNDQLKEVLFDTLDCYILLNTEEEMTDEKYADLLGNVCAVIESNESRTKQAGAGLIDPAPVFPWSRQ